MTKTKQVSTKFIKAVKYLPKFIGSTQELLVNQEILDFLEEEVLPISVTTESAKKHLLRTHLLDSPGDESTVELHMKGREDLVALAKGKLASFVHTQIAQYNSQTLLDNDNTIEVDVKFDATRHLGFTTGKVSTWAEVQQGGQFQEIFGPQANRGAVVISMGILGDGAMEMVSNRKQRNQIVKKANSRYASSGKDVDKWVVVRICLNKDEYIGGLDSSRIVTRNGQQIHCRDGTAYLGKWRQLNQVSAPKTQQLNGIAPTISSGKVPRKPSTDGPSSTDAANTIPRKRKADEKEADNSSYRHFIEKISQVKAIEYKGMIHLHAANKSMWAAHKRLFGAHCDDKCECVSQMRDLTKDVIADYVADHTTEPDWKPPSNIHSSPGFASYFCPKFFSKVESAFPNDTPAQILLKLVDMWQGHKGQLRFKGFCLDDCPCLDCWDLLFLPICKGEQKKQTATMLGKKKKKKKPPQISSQTAFESSYKPFRYSLGFFCETKVIGGTKKCIITSVDPKRRAQQAKISVGTIVEAYQVGTSPKIQINSHHALQKAYSALKTRGDNTTLKLSFKVGPVPKEIDCSKDWSSMNAWIGKSKTPGWAGGAMLGYAGSGNKTPADLTGAQIPQKGQTAKILSTMKVKIAHANANANAKVNPKTKVKTHAPRILKLASTKGSTTVGEEVTRVAKVRFDLGKITTHTFLKDYQDANRAQSMAGDRLIEAALSGSPELLVQSLKHCVHDLKFEQPLTLICQRIELLKRDIDFPEKDGDTVLERTLKKKEIEKELQGYELKTKALKLFAKANAILDATDKFIQDPKVAIEHVQQEYQKLSTELKTMHVWIQKFREETTRHGKDLRVDANIDKLGISLLHSAVYVGDTDRITQLIGDGANPSTSNVDVGTPLHLAKALKEEALRCNDSDWTKKYTKVIDLLENLHK